MGSQHVTLFQIVPIEICYVLQKNYLKSIPRDVIRVIYTMYMRINHREYEFKRDVLEAAKKTFGDKRWSSNMFKELVVTSDSRYTKKIRYLIHRDVYDSDALNLLTSLSIVSRRRVYCTYRMLIVLNKNYVTQDKEILWRCQDAILRYQQQLNSHIHMTIRELVPSISDIIIVERYVDCNDCLLSSRSKIYEF